MYRSTKKKESNELEETKRNTRVGSLVLYAIICLCLYKIFIIYIVSINIKIQIYFSLYKKIYIYCLLVIPLFFFTYGGHSLVPIPPLFFSFLFLFLHVKCVTPLFLTSQIPPFSSQNHTFNYCYAPSLSLLFQWYLMFFLFFENNHKFSHS